MPKIYKDNICISCGETYTGRGAYFCSNDCSISFRRGDADGVVIDKMGEIFQQFLPDYEPFMSIEADEAIICADLHMPKVHIDMFKKLIKIADIYMKPPRTIVIAGDLFDFSALSKFDLIDKDENVDRDFNSGRVGLNILAKYFDTIVYAMGNHDIRFMKKLEWFISVDEFAYGLLSSNKLKITPYPCLDVTSGGVDFHVTHPSNYSRVGNVPVSLAAIHRKPVLSFHGHLFHMRTEPSGQDFGYDVGCMTDRTKHLYTKVRETNHPIWTAGFALLRNGSVLPFTDNPKITNWNFWLEELPSKFRNGRLY
jgi:hypothetical protein